MLFKKKERFADLGTTKRDTNAIIDEAIEKQKLWKRAKGMFGMLIPAKKKPSPAKNLVPAKKKSDMKKEQTKKSDATSSKKSVLAAYWFPILCAIIILILIAWLFVPGCTRRDATVVPEPTTKTVPVVSGDAVERTLPTFDVVRIERGGHIVVAGFYRASTGVSIRLNNKIVATEMTTKNGDFVYSPAKPLAPGNYTLQLVGADNNSVSENKVFLYVSDHGDENSLSLLMTKDGSTLLQSPKLVDGDLVVSKIDYLKSGRIVATGRALPRLRVSLVLDGRELGFARVSDYKNFGLGANVGKLNPGTEYTLSVRLHDGDGETVAKVMHKFVMPKPTGADDTFYTVRRGDALWIIARNFLGRGILFSIIAEKNNIKNPDLIFPDQKLQIPVKE